MIYMFPHQVFHFIEDSGKTMAVDKGKKYLYLQIIVNISQHENFQCNITHSLEIYPKLCLVYRWGKYKWSPKYANIYLGII